MTAFMSKYQEQTYALMRITTGFMFACHGWPKLMRIMQAETFEFTRYVIAMPIELIGGALVMVGLFTRPVAFLCSGMGAAAYWVGHFSTEKYLPIMNNGDAAALYAFVFLFIAAKGTGIWGLSKN